MYNYFILKVFYPIICNMRKLSLIIVFLGLLGISSNAQNSPKMRSASSGKGLIYNRERLMMGEIHTNGANIAYQWGSLKTYYKTTYYELSLGFLKHPKETRNTLSAANLNPARAFIYGKQNVLMPLGLYYGEKRYFSEKDTYRGVAVGMNYAIGPNLGLLKPYYIEYRTGDAPKPTDEIKYSEANHKIFLDKEKITGSSSFTKGLNEIKIQPAVHAKLGLHLDWGAFDEYVRALEVGFTADYYFKKVPILVDKAQNRSIFVNFYANLQLGKRK